MKDRQTTSIEKISEAIVLIKAAHKEVFNLRNNNLSLDMKKLKDKLENFYKDEISSLKKSSGVAIKGHLCNEASQDSEGNPVYIFWDEKKNGYDAWVQINPGDILKVYHPNEDFIAYEGPVLDKVSQYSYPFINDNFELKVHKDWNHWFNRNLKAEIFKPDINNI